MTLVLPMTNFYTPLAVIEGDQCLEDEGYFCDEWNTSSDFDFLETCTNPSEDIYPGKDLGQGIKRKHLELEESPVTGCADLFEQQRFVLKLSFEKLRQLEDPESCLRRSVLINNTLKYLHTQMYPVETPCYEFYAGFNSPNHSPVNISPLERKRSLTSIQSEVSQQSTVSEINSTELQVPDVSSSRGFTSEKQDKHLPQATFEGQQTVDQPLAESMKYERESIFSELDSVFHNFICALET